MKFRSTMIAWVPETDRIHVGPWPDRTGWSDAYSRTDGACFSDVRNVPPDRRLAMLFIAFNTIVVRDKVPAEAVHRAFLAIDEYRKAIAPDTPGADA